MFAVEDKDDKTTAAHQNKPRAFIISTVKHKEKPDKGAKKKTPNKTTRKPAWKTKSSMFKVSSLCYIILICLVVARLSLNWCGRGRLAQRSTKSYTQTYGHWDYSFDADTCWFNFFDQFNSVGWKPFFPQDLAASWFEYGMANESTRVFWELPLGALLEKDWVQILFQKSTNIFHLKKWGRNQAHVSSCCLCFWLFVNLFGGFQKWWYHKMDGL